MHCFKSLILSSYVILSFTVLFGCKGDSNGGNSNRSDSNSQIETSEDQVETGEDGHGNKSDIQLKFLDEYIYPANQSFKGTKIGGLSGITNLENSVDDKFKQRVKNGLKNHSGNTFGDTYYIVSDDYKTPRYYRAEICIEKNKIKNVSFKDVIYFDMKDEYFASHFLDLESIIYHNGDVIISSEGSVHRNRRPVIFASDLKGNFVSEYTIPEHFLTQSRHNGVFESLTKSIDGKGLWCVNELPLKSDGTEAQYPTTHSPLRFTYYDYKTQKATKEFVYELSPLPLPKKSQHDMIGVSDVLEYDNNKFLVIERAFQGKNIVRIYNAVINKNSTNSLNIKDLKTSNYIPMKKELVFDFKDVKSKLTHRKIDNIEGITFGKTLENGHRSIIVISDDNFQRHGNQLTQFILLELVL